MPPDSTLENQTSLAFQRSRAVNSLIGIGPTNTDADSSRIQQRREEDDDVNDDYSSELPADWLLDNNNRPERGRSRVRHPTTPLSTITAHSYEILRNIVEETLAVNGHHHHHVVHSVGSEEPAVTFCESLELRSDRPGNWEYRDPEARSLATRNLCTLCQNRIEGSAPEVQRPSRNEVDENSPVICNLRSESSNGTGSNYNPVYPHSRRRVPAPPPPQMPQQQQQIPPLRSSLRRRSQSMNPLRSDPEHIPYYRETGTVMLYFITLCPMNQYSSE